MKPRQGSRATSPPSSLHLPKNSTPGTLQHPDTETSQHRNTVPLPLASLLPRIGLANDSSFSTHPPTIQDMKAALSIAFDELRGKAGSVVVRNGRTGLVVVPRKSGKNPRTAAQQTARQNLAKAAAAFKGLTPTQLAAWKTYAAGLNRVNPVNGESYHPTAIDAFVGLTTKFLQATPNGTIPLTPPTTAFAGDSITVTATAGVGKVTFNGSGSNTAGVKTELLLQPLASANRTPNAKSYRTKAVVALTSGSPQDVSVPAGYYAAAYRFIKTATGQATNLQPIGVATVTLSVSESEPKSSTSGSTSPRAATKATRSSVRHTKPAA